VNYVSNNKPYMLSTTRVRIFGVTNYNKIFDHIPPGKQANKS